MSRNSNNSESAGSAAQVLRRLTSRSSGRVGRPRSGFAGSASWRAAQLQIR